MASRYWVGGTAEWNNQADTKWALTSGGAGGQAVPTASDAVFFDAASGAVTVTGNPSFSYASSINCTGFTGTLTGYVNATTVTLASSMASASSLNITFTGAASLTSAGKAINDVLASTTSTTIVDDLTCGYLRAASYGVNGNVNLSSRTLNGTLQGHAGSTSTVNLTNATINGAVILTGGSSLTGSTTCTVNSSGTVFTCSGQPWGILNIGSAVTSFQITAGNGSFTQINFNPTAAATLEFQAGVTTTVGTANINGASFANPLTIRSIGGSASTHQLTKSGGGTVTGNFLKIEHSVATPANTWYATNSIDNNNIATAGSGWNISRPLFNLFSGSNY